MPSTIPADVSCSDGHKLLTMARTAIESLLLAGSRLLRLVCVD